MFDFLIPDRVFLNKANDFCEEGNYDLLENFIDENQYVLSKNVDEYIPLIKLYIATEDYKNLTIILEEFREKYCTDYDIHKQNITIPDTRGAWFIVEEKVINNQLYYHAYHETCFDIGIFPHCWLNINLERVPQFDNMTAKDLDKLTLDNL